MPSPVASRILGQSFDRIIPEKTLRPLAHFNLGAQPLRTLGPGYLVTDPLKRSWKKNSMPWIGTYTCFFRGSYGDGSEEICWWKMRVGSPFQRFTYHVDGSEIRRENQLSMVLHRPFLWEVLFSSLGGCWGFLPSTVVHEYLIGKIKGEYHMFQYFDFGQS